jgi:hypothetical protein
MRRLLASLVVLLVFPRVAFGNPVAPTSLPPDAALLSAVLVEVSIVSVLLWRRQLRMPLFIPFWYIINLVSFYVLPSGFENLIYVLHLYDKVNALVLVVAMELFVVVVEATILYAVSRSPLALKADSKVVSWRLAFLASLLGNVGSVVAHVLVSRIK